MADITIGPSGTDSGTSFTQPSAAAYAALAGGGVLNTVTWTGGAVYRPSAGKWWGLDRRRGVPKRIRHIFSGYTGSNATRAYADGRVYFDPAGTDGAYVGGNIWRLDYATSGIPGVPVVECWVGARGSATVSGLVIGERYRQADSLLDVTSAGATLAGMRAGDGIWWGQANGSTIELYIWCPAGAEAYPAAQWDGIAMTVTTSGVGNAGSPCYSPWVFERDGSNTPNGSIVDAGCASVGVAFHHFGSVVETAAVGSLPWEDVQYADVAGYGGRSLAIVGSNASGTTVTNVNCSGLYWDQSSDPSHYPSNSGDSQNNEGVSLRARAKTCIWQNGTLIMSNSHAALSVGGSPTVVVEERVTASRFSNIRALFKVGAQDARGFSGDNSDDFIAERILVEGATTQGHLGGVNTLVHSSEWRGGQLAQNDSTESYASVDARADLDGLPSAVRIKFYRNVIDRRGDLARGVTDPRSCLSIKSTAAGAFPAGGLDARDNVMIGDSGTCAVWVVEKSASNLVDRNQRVTGTQHNLAVEARATTNPGTAIGSDSTLAVVLNTGTTSGTQYVASGEILSRGDRHASRYGEISLPG